MSSQLKIKTIILIVIAFVGLVVMGFTVSTMQGNLNLSNFDEEMAQELSEMPTLIEQAEEETAENTKTYDAIYQSKAESVAFMAQNNAGYEQTDTKMLELANLMSVDNLLVVTREGEVLAQAADTQADFTHERYNRLRTVFDTGEPSEAVAVQMEERAWDSRYYAARIDDATMVVVEQNPAELEELVEESGSTESLLKNITIGQHGYMFAVSATDYLIEYHPDSTLVGADAIDEGITVADLEDGNYAWMTLHGERLYCAVTQVDDMYYVAAVPESDLTNSRLATSAVILFIFCMVIVLVVIYGVCMLRDRERRAKRDADKDADDAQVAALKTAAMEEATAAAMAKEAAAGGGAGGAGAEAGAEVAAATAEAAAAAAAETQRATNAQSSKTWRFNKDVARKAAALSLVGFVAILVCSFYMQTLFALSTETVTNNERVASIKQTIVSANERASALEEQYKERYLSKCRVAGYIIDANPTLANKEDLGRLADVLQVQYLFTFNGQGVMTATNSSYANFTVSSDPEDQSYEFAKLLQGADSVVQDAQPDEISGELRQYIGVSLHNSAGTVEGFVQISIRPSRLETLLESVQIDNVLDGVRVGADGFAFAINKEDNTFAYFPKDNLAGKDVFKYGVTENQMRDGFCDYITIDGTTYYASCAEQGDYYLYVAGTEGELMAERGHLTLACGVIAFVCLALIFCVLAFERVSSGRTLRARAGAAGARAGAAGAGAAVAGGAAGARAGASAAGAGAADNNDERMVDVTLPGGRRVTTESAASRWLGRSFKWSEKTPEQQVATVAKVFVAVFVVAICIAVIFKDSIFPSGSIFAYILGGEWDYGLNIFAITASLMFACVAMTIATIIGQLLKVLAGTLNARGETVCRMVSSFIKYATIIGMVYYCLMLIGIDTTTLLASAGILSIAISFGAKELVTDIISGLFIIFEGEFRVGDIIKVGDWRGTVVEIGVRTTKVEDGNKNIKVIRNSDVNNVINMTKRMSFAQCDVGIEYTESLERVENILAAELPEIAKRYPAITSGPFYKGVVELGDNSVSLRVVAQCSEEDRGQLENDLKREMKLIFDEHDISMPFPQVVVHDPSERKEVSDLEKLKAEYYTQDQKEQAKEIGNADANEGL